MKPIDLLFSLCFLCVIGLVKPQPSGFSKDGSIQQVLFAQQAVNRVDDHSVLAIKYQSCTIITTISKTKSFMSKLRTQSESFTDDVPLYKTPRLRCFLVGTKADAQQGRTLCGDLDSMCRSNEGRLISAPRLALHLADEFQRYSMGSNPFRRQAINALIVNTDIENTKHTNNFGDIYTVDTSGSFASVKAGCIGGSRAERVNSWLNSRGRYLATRWLQRYAPSGSDQSDVNAMHSDTMEDSQDDIHEDLTAAAVASPVQDVDSSSITGCFNITASCLLENFPNDALINGNYTVSVTVLSDSPCSKAPRITRSCTIPVHILEGLVAFKEDSSSSSSSSSSSKGLLAQWWQQLQAGSDDCSSSCSTNTVATSRSSMTDYVSDTMLPLWQVIPS